jgi:hypothetical protein
MSLTTWCPVPGTSVTTGNGVVTITADGNSDYDTFVGFGRGFAPMYVGLLDSSASVSAVVSLNNTYKSNSNVFAGFMLLNESYIPMFEYGIGGSNKGSLDPIKVKSPETLDISVNSSRVTTSKTNNIELTKPPTYIAFYLRGSGVNTVSFTTVTMSGLRVASLPDSITFNFQLQKADYYGDTIYNYGLVSNLDECKKICSSDITASGFSYDSSTRLCKIFQDLEITKFKSGGPSSDIYVKDVPVLSDVYVCAKNGTYSSASVNDVNITLIAIDSTDGYNDAVVVTDSGIFVADSFIYQPISPNGTNTAVLTIGIKINNQYIYIYSLNNYDFKRIGIMDASYNIVSAAFINQHVNFDPTRSGIWYLSSSNSYTNTHQIQTYSQVYLNYGGGTHANLPRYKIVTPDKNTEVLSMKSISPCKLVGEGGFNRFMCINQRMMIVLTASNNSTWGEETVKGSLLFNYDGLPLDSSGKTIGTTPSLSSPETGFYFTIRCPGTYNGSLHVKTSPSIYRNYINTHTIVLYDKNYTFNENTYALAQSPYTLRDVEGLGCMAIITSSSTLPPNVTYIYANVSEESISDDDFGKFPLFVEYSKNGRRVIIEFTLTPQPVNFIR